MDKNKGNPNYLALTAKKWPGMTKAGLLKRWRKRDTGVSKRGPKPFLTMQGEAAFVEYVKAQQDIHNCLDYSELGAKAKEWATKQTTRA